MFIQKEYLDEHFFVMGENIWLTWLMIFFVFFRLFLFIFKRQSGINYIKENCKESQQNKEKYTYKWYPVIYTKLKNGCCSHLEKAKREEQKRIQLEKEIEERKRQEEKRKKEEEERRKREEEERRRQEEERRRQEEERIRREQEERRRAQYFPGTNYGGCSIVDGLKSIGADSSYNYRCSIAARNGIGGYVGSPAQNTHMLNLLKSGNLLRPWNYN